MRNWFMLKDGEHHRVDEGLYLHFRETCNVHETTEISSAQSPFAPRTTAMEEIRLASSPVGLVAICYERKGVITFFAQIGPTRAAWQRIEWLPDFDQHWDEKKVQEALDNFLWVARCEEAQQLLPR